MRRNFTAAALAAGLACGLAACEAKKSSNPLSPTVAGPIAGVSITTPQLIEPAKGVKYKESQQPIKLIVGNATTTGVRTVSYIFEVASDAAFNSKVFARAGVPEGGGGRTSVQIDRLESGRGYFWRAKADDGANSSDYSSSQFEILPKPVLNAPVLASPINNQQVTTRRPALTLNDSERNSAIGSLQYEFQLATDQAFTRLIAAGMVDETPGQTSFGPNVDLAFDLQHFWRARATDRDTTSAWSITQTFRGVASPAPSPAPGPAPGPVGDWTKCGSTPGEDLVKCVHAAVNPARTPEGAFEVTKRVAWLLRGSGGGLLIKNGGENIVSWMGYSFSAARICYPDGHIYKVLSDVPTTNGPTWQDNDFVDRSLYLPAIDPR
jgi:hypothetical protein